jgi:hypothetical protein
MTDSPLARIGLGGLLAAALLFLLTPAAGANTISVPDDRATIQGAVNAADPGDRILVEARKRRYFESVEVTTNRLEIVGVAKRGELPVVDGTARGGSTDELVFDIDADDVTVRRLELQHGLGSDCTGMRCEFSGVEVHMSDQSGDCIEIDGGQGRVERSRFIGCDDNAVDIDGVLGKVRFNYIRQVDNDCVIVDGDKALVERNRVHNCEDSEGIDVDGNGAEIRRNLVRSTDANAYEVDGNFNLVKDNNALNIEDDCFDIDGIKSRVTDNGAKACDGGWEVSGENMRVIGNRGSLLGDDAGFDVDCSDRTGGAAEANVCKQAVIAENRAEDNNNDDEGFEIDDFVGDGGLVIRDNRAVDNNDGGFEIDVDRSRISGNVSLRDGAEGNEPGLEIDGVRNVIVGNRAVSSGEHGLEISGNNTQVRRNISRRANVDGINIESGDDLVARLNEAFSNNGDGIENDATATKLIRNVSAGNRRDCANDGTIAVKRRNRCKDGSNFNGPGTLDRPARR